MIRASYRSGDVAWTEYSRVFVENVCKIRLNHSQYRSSWSDTLSNGRDKLLYHKSEPQQSWERDISHITNEPLQLVEIEE